MRYCDWLVEKGSRLDTVPNQLGVSAAHSVARGFGRFAALEFLSDTKSPGLSSKLKDLCSAVRTFEAFARIPYACAPEDGCLPMNFFMTGCDDVLSEQCEALEWETTDLNVWLVKWLSDTVRGFDSSIPMRSAILRCITMEELGIRHLCRHSSIGPRMSKEKVEELQEDWGEVLDEDRQLIEELDMLVEEFGEYVSRNTSLPRFLQGYLRKKVDEEREIRSRILDEDQERALREIGVVMDR